MTRLALMMVLLLAFPAAADLQKGRTAFEADDFEAAEAAFKSDADGGNAEGEYWMGRVRDARSDPAGGYQWFLKAANRGHAEAQRSVGVLLEEARGVARNEVKAAEWYRKSAEQGNDKAQRNLANFHRDGRGGLKQDPAEAFRWYEAAAKQGNAKAGRSLAYMYYFGDGTRQDLARAAQLFAAASDDGLAAAHFDLGRLYYRGQGVERDFLRAAELFEQAARSGYGKAQLWLGRMYFTGEGVAKNEAEAYFWLTLAEAQEPEGARHFLARLDRSLPEAGRKAAKQRAKQFDPK
ncbi:MAG: sel1 repeat family protein [Alphaproteobacteria bacterium]|nr:sel1 repeat family protein [Alphaproteobacteria bacterium]